MGIEPVDAISDLSHRRQLRLIGPDKVIVFASGKRHPRGNGACRRPPGPEHVRMHHVGSSQALPEPSGESRITTPLQIVLGTHHLRLDAVGSSQPDPDVRGRSDQKTSPVPPCRQRLTDAQQRKLRTARLQLRKDSAEEHASKT